MQHPIFQIPACIHPEGRYGILKGKKLTVVSTLHYIRLVYRSILFLLLVINYIIFKFRSGAPITSTIERWPAILVVTWTVFVVEMILRFFPSSMESPGCQKQFKRNYIKSGETNIVIQDNNATFLVALLWIVFNAIFGALHMMGIFDDGIMVLLCGAYSVCDMICILFFCPFQTWFMKNKCCTTCRIYNWDYAMMFTPMLFLGNFYGLSLLGIALALLVQWEVLAYRHPERFSETTNRCLTCPNCTEKLCHHKKQLRSFWQKNRDLLVIKGNAILSEYRKKK